MRRRLQPSSIAYSASLLVKPLFLKVYWTAGQEASTTSASLMSVLLLTSGRASVICSAARSRSESASQAPGSIGGLERALEGAIEGVLGGILKGGPTLV